MRSLAIAILLVVTANLVAQVPDLDDLARDLDLSPLTPSATPSAPETELPPARADLHAGRDNLPPSPAPPAAENPDDLLFLALPAGPRLVIPNPPRLDLAWPLLHDSISSARLQLNGPLFVVLHADGNFSVAASILRDEPKPLPLGADISPGDALALAGRWETLPEARRDHPAVLAAFQRLRKQIAERGQQADTREFYFFPAAEGRVFFALRLLDSDPSR